MPVVIGYVVYTLACILAEHPGMDLPCVDRDCSRRR